MFDDDNLSGKTNVPPRTAPPPRAVGHEPEDIFSDIEPVPGGTTRPVPPRPGIASPLQRPSAPAPIPPRPPVFRKAAPPPNLGSVAAPTQVNRPQAPSPIPSRPREAMLRPGLNQEADDILSDVEQSSPVIRGPAAVSRPPQFQPRSGAPAMAEPKFDLPGLPSEKQPRQSRLKLVVILAASIIGLAVLGLGGFLVYNQLTSLGTPSINYDQPADEPEDGETAETPEDNSNEAVNQAVNTIIPPVEPDIDSDLDGLFNKEEALYGTDPQLVDSDGDSLTDRDEVKVFKTDPLSQDSDGDGFTDFVELQNGYNPRGSGKYKEVPAQ